MSFKIRVYAGDQIRSFTLSDMGKTFSVGSGNTDTVKVSYPDVIPSHVRFAYINGAWVCQNFATRQSKNIVNGDSIVLSMQNRVAVMVSTEEAAAQSVELRPNSKVLIGRNTDCAFFLPDRSVGRTHAEIIVDEMGAKIRDLNSAMGTYVNNRKITTTNLREGDMISVGKYDIRYKRHSLELWIEGQQEGKVDKVVKNKKDSKYPVFSLSPRLRHQTPSEIIEIQAPPNIGNMPMVNWLSFLPMLATRSPYSAIFPLTSVFSTFLEKKKYKAAQEVRTEKYEKYLEDVKAKIDKNREDQFLSLEESNHETSVCYDIAVNRKRTLWERSPQDDDFMKVRIGKGNIETSFRIKFPDSVLKLYNDDLESQGEELGKGNQILEDAPILCDLFHDLSIGIIGDREKALNVARNMIVQLATTHSYKDLKIVSLYSKREAANWEFTKWLPHAFSDSREVRYVANDVFKTATLEKVLDEELKERKRVDAKEEEGLNLTPFYLFVVSNPELIEETEIENYLDHAEVGVGIGVIYVYKELKDLPKSCNVIIDVSKSKNEVFHKWNIGNKQEFKIDSFSAAKAEDFARKLAPVRLAEKKSQAEMPSTVTFLEGYGVKRAEELPIWKNWNNTNPAKSMAVPLGVRSNGEPFMFNMMYGSDFMRYHGSHGLLAGTNGSGKSEMLQSWILSMALRFSPEEVSFVIIDYKGTGLLRPFEKLPHLAGKFSNIDGNVRRNIISINEEMKRRQVIFDKAGIHPEIKEYFAKGFHKTLEPMPVIVMVIDEFAEITKNLPDLVPVLESIFALGRSLGIWAIVSTQKPSGVVTAKMYANSKFRWCCRVASSGDSKEMLRHTDAAKIKNAGRAYVQIGEDDIYEQVQSYWSGAPYAPERKEKLSTETTISMVDITGKRVQYEVDRTEKLSSAMKEIDAVVAEINRVAEEHHVAKARQLWKAPLPGRIYLNDISYYDDSDDFVVPYGMIDNPYVQSQYPTAINFSKDGHTFIYGLPGSGKTTFLQTCIMSIAKKYDPQEVNIYGMDFGSWNLSLFANLPHMGGVANDNESEKIVKLIDLLRDELDMRKKTFAMKGIINIKAYNQFAEEKMPYIVLMVDNLAALFAMYPELDTFFIRLSREGASYGIFLLATTGSNSGINFKITANIKSGIVLQMKDKTDYDMIVGKTNGLTPCNMEGRGLVRENGRALEFQLALPTKGETENEVLVNLREEILEIEKEYIDYKAKMIPIMPDMVRYDSVTSQAITLGLTTEKITPIEIDFSKMPHTVVVSGNHNTGTSNILKVIVKQFQQKVGGKIVLFDNGTGQLNNVKAYADSYLLSASAFDDYFDELKQEMNDRMERAEEGDFDFEPILIVVDGYRKMYEAITDLTATRLKTLVTMCDRHKVYFVSSETPESLKWLQGQEAIMKYMIANATAILMGGTFYSHNVFTSDIEYSEGMKPLGEFEAYLLSKGHAEKFKAMHEF